jgi:hypothetical protein
MSKSWMILTGLLFLGPVGTSQAQPSDSPGTVYIDGLPCNSICQSYMAWSRQHTPTAVVQPASAQPTQRSSDTEVRHATATHRESSEPAVDIRVAKQASPSAEIAEPHRAGDAAVTSDHAVGMAATSNARTVQEQVAAAKALADRLTSLTVAPVPEQEASNVVGSGFTEASQASDTGSAASTPTGNTANLVAVLIARPEIRSVSDLAGKDVAVENRRSASNALIRTAIAAAGAAEVQLNEGRAKALDRVIGGEVPAAVLALVSPEAAEWFPDIPGFRIFRVPLAPRH